MSAPASNLNALRIRRSLGHREWDAPAPYGPDGWTFAHRAMPGSIIVSCAPAEDGQEWVHASIAWQYRMPTYDDLKLLHRAVFGDGWAYQVFAPGSEHVNIHQYALHLFGRLDGRPALPDFTRGSGSI
jgi:hypothetical protein